MARKLRFSRIRARRPVSGPKNWTFSNIGMWPLVGNRRTSGSRKKYFWSNLAFWVEIWAKKGHFGSKFSKKWKNFQNFFFRIEWFWDEKRPKKRWKFFFLSKLVWHLVIFGQKMRIIDIKDFLMVLKVLKVFDDYGYIFYID